MRRFVWLLAAFCFTGAAAQTEDSLFIKKLSEEILFRSTAYENLRVLCKTVGPRLAGSAGMPKAEAWGQKALQTAGADKVWLQACMVPHWVRGAGEEAWYTVKGASAKTKLYILALGNSVGTGNAGLTLPAILVNDFDDLEAKKDQLKGKIVVYNNFFDNSMLETFKAYGVDGIYRRSGPSRAARYGAKAVLIRSISGSTDNYPHTGGTSYDSSLPKIPAAAMGLQDADKLIAQLKAGKEVTVFYRSNAQMLPDVQGHNVIGELKGSQFPDKYITVGGHLDSWDPSEGAHDDGTGCVHAIEVLRALKAIGYTPRHTIRAVLFANEENGARGGRKYAEEARDKNEQHILAMESDAGGFTPRGFSFTLPAEKLTKIKSWAPLLQPYGTYLFTSDGGGTDVGPLNRVLGTPVGELIPDGARYFDIHHTPNDVFENVNKRELDLGALNMAILIYLVDKYGIE